MTIKKILIANRGEIARRIIRTIRRMNRAAVAVYSEADARSPHLAEADEAILLGAADPKQSYLNIDRIIEAAVRSQADAIHPGYGFLSESPAFARAVIGAGLVFIGPAPEALELLGEKDRARSLAGQLNIPVARGGTYPAGATSDISQLIGELTFPILLKAAAGGGGRGMRIVHSAADLAAAAEAAKREAEASFGSGALIIEEFVAPARHIEIQLLADVHGTVLHLFERDCSVQRRNQKVIEESPARNLPQALRERLCQDAIAIARAGKLTGAATAEFLVRLDGSGQPTGDFVFLEVNPRIQVEHPVTEMVTGIDIVEQQIRIAEGLPLPFSQEQIQCRGHAIQARLYAEIPELGYLPAAGTIREFSLPEETPCLLRFEHALVSGTLLRTDYDPMLAKLIVWGKSFEEAAASLGAALAATEIAGVPNNLRFLALLLVEPHFQSATLPVNFLASWNVPPPAESDAFTAALFTAAVELLRGAERYGPSAFARPFLPAHSREHTLALPSQTYLVTSSHGAAESEAIFRIHAAELTQAGLHLTVRAQDGSLQPVILHRAGRGFALESAGTTHFGFANFRQAATWQTPADSPSLLTLLHQEFRVGVKPLVSRSTAAGSESPTLKSPLPGTVLKVLVKEGEAVVQGAALFIIESMKMEHHLHAPAAGLFTECRVAVGSKVSAGDLLCRIG